VCLHCRYCCAASDASAPPLPVAVLIGGLFACGRTVLVQHAYAVMAKVVNHFSNSRILQSGVWKWGGSPSAAGLTDSGYLVENRHSDKYSTLPGAGSICLKPAPL